MNNMCFTNPDSGAFYYLGDKVRVDGMAVGTIEYIGRYGFTLKQEDGRALSFHRAARLEILQVGGLGRTGLTPEQRKAIQESYSWIKVNRWVDDESLTWEERFHRLKDHHEKETKFLIDFVRKLAP